MPKTLSSRLFFALIAVVLAFIITRNLYHRYLSNALVDAVEANNAVRVRSLLDRGADAKTEDSRGDNRRTGTPVLAMAMNSLRGPVTDSNGVTAPEQVACLLIEHGAYDRSTDTGPPTQLETVAENGSVPVARCLLEHGADPNFMDCNHDTALDAAFTYGSAGYGYSAAGVRTAAPDAARRIRVSREMIALMRQHGARITPRQAVQLGDVSLLNQTLSAGGDANEHKQNEGTALYEAAKQGSLPMMQMLLTHGADVNACTRFNGAPLDAAASKGNLNAVKLLLAHGANVNLAGRDAHSPLVNAIAARCADIARLLLEHGADPNLEHAADSYLTDALSAAARSLPELVPELLAHHADINADNGAPLSAAIRAHHPDLVRYLLGHGAKIYPARPPRVSHTPGGGASGVSFSSTPPSASTLRTAVINGPESFDLLMQAGATLGNDKADILLAAASAGHAVLYDRLIALGANVNAVDAAGNTPLTEALRYAPAGIQTLLEHGANPNAVMRSGQTPLLIAVQTANTDLARLLLAHGATPNLKPPRGHTVMFYARRHPNAGIVRLLEQAGAKAE